jgi:hypothetical protein
MSVGGHTLGIAAWMTSCAGQSLRIAGAVVSVVGHGARFTARGMSIAGASLRLGGELIS